MMYFQSLYSLYLFHGCLNKFKFFLNIFIKKMINFIYVNSSIFDTIRIFMLKYESYFNIIFEWFKKYVLATLTEAHCCERHFCFQHLHTTIDNCTFKIATKKSDSSSHKEVGCLSILSVSKDLANRGSDCV